MKPYVFITGAAGGLGSAFALDCARRGYDLVLSDYHPEVENLACYLMAKFDVEVQFFICDLTSPQARNELYGFIASRDVRPWMLINVAGMDNEGAFLDRPREQILNILRLNIESTVDTTYNLIKLRDPSQRFRLINVCSLAAVTPMPYKAIYAASKRFLLDFSMALGEEIGPIGTVTALCPAGMPTTADCMRKIFAQGMMGAVTTVNTQAVAKRTIDSALKGRRTFIPGILNQAINWLSTLVPVSFTVRMVGKRWKKAQEEQESAWVPGMRNGGLIMPQNEKYAAINTL
jgi:uncharacterized protein